MRFSGPTASATTRSGRRGFRSRMPPVRRGSRVKDATHLLLLRVTEHRRRPLCPKASKLPITFPITRRFLSLRTKKEPSASCSCEGLCRPDATAPPRSRWSGPRRERLTIRAPSGSGDCGHLTSFCGGCQLFPVNDVLSLLGALEHALPPRPELHGGTEPGDSSTDNQHVGGSGLVFHELTLFLPGTATQAVFQAAVTHWLRTWPRGTRVCHRAIDCQAPDARRCYSIELMGLGGTSPAFDATI